MRARQSGRRRRRAGKLDDMETLSSQNGGAYRSASGYKQTFTGLRQRVRFTPETGRKKRSVRFNYTLAGSLVDRLPTFRLGPQFLRLRREFEVARQAVGHLAPAHLG